MSQTHKIIIKESDSEVGPSLFQICLNDSKKFINFRTLKKLYLFDHNLKNKYNSKTTEFHNMNPDNGLATYIYLLAEQMNIPILQIKKICKCDLLIECGSIERGYTYKEITEYINFLTSWVTHLEQINNIGFISDAKIKFINELYCKK